SNPPSVGTEKPALPFVRVFARLRTASAQRTFHLQTERNAKPGGRLLRMSKVESNDQTKNGEKRAQAPSRKRHSRWRTFFFIIFALVILFAIARAILPWGVRKYVNRTLDRNELYSGTIGQVQIHLWRGAYSIHDIKISKRTGNVPVPFFSAGT